MRESFNTYFIYLIIQTKTCIFVKYFLPYNKYEFFKNDMYVQNNMRVLLTMIKILFYFIIREPFITSLSFQVSFDRFFTRDYKIQII